MGYFEISLGRGILLNPDNSFTGTNNLWDGVGNYLAMLRLCASQPAKSHGLLFHVGRLRPPVRQGLCQLVRTCLGFLILNTMVNLPF